jgi:hypothetical protein
MQGDLTMVRFVSLFAILLVFGLTACSSGSSQCSKACKHVTACNPNASCNLSAQCTTLESCQAKCLNAASCEALNGTDAVGAAALASCLGQCGGTTTPPPPTSDGQVTLPGDGGTCTPDCTGKQCGPDGCGGTCGDCTAPEVCNTQLGQCVTQCTPNCAGKQCGDDGCSGSCGTCLGNTSCNAAGQCVCTPDCAGKQCGPDGCGGSCGSCTGSTSCNAAGQCVCTPNCAGKQCGSDGCGGTCGTCPTNQTCNTTTGTCAQPAASSGAICFPNQTPCADPNETCMTMETGATVGMCHEACTPAGSQCQVPNASTQLSICGLSDTAGNNYCGWFCELQGATYACPNTYDYDCKALDPNSPDIKLCMPKAQ